MKRRPKCFVKFEFIVELPMTPKAWKRRQDDLFKRYDGLEEAVEVPPGLDPDSEAIDAAVQLLGGELHSSAIGLAPKDEVRPSNPKQWREYIRKRMQRWGT